MEKGVNFSGDSFVFNNLLKFKLWGCDESSFIFNRSNIASSSHGAGEAITMFPAVKNLIIELVEFLGLELPPIHPNISIESISLTGWDKLKSLPHQLQHFTALKELRIQNFNGVEAFPDWLRGLSSLNALSITSCNKLKRIPEECLGRLTCLKELRLGPFSLELEDIPGLTSIHHLHASLNYLTSYGWDKLKLLPHQLRHLTALKQLIVMEFNEVEAIPEWLELRRPLFSIGS
ncbi:hypothetical protein SLEP1_g14729 [Rubroshorea leprosula]|uniref:R13L1/DRL21-like LRR repeat region domain-containing protein n=1 Tax=Rubroshorea leprosula TaxID=152421 RepID=A0AAV5IK05_9ROSI|nr:hypothetical protein SLEP1_g14729 [Rubroshorea leprosula]